MDHVFPPRVMVQDHVCWSFKCTVGAPTPQYWENLLVPLDNMITRDTQRFVTSKDPDYLTSAYQVRAAGVRGPRTNELRGWNQPSNASSLGLCRLSPF